MTAIASEAAKTHRTKLYGLSICMALLLFAFNGHADTSANTQVSSTLDRSVLETIQASTFEVVIPKPSQDPLTYEKPLPMHLVPYTVRTDKYYSVGTAFAISAREFVTAAHVINLGMDSQLKGAFLRGAKGKVYAIEKIVKFSERRDFAVFSAKGIRVKQWLAVNDKPELNEKVYAVGNALGEGIVIRDGLYTSRTPEDLEGKWKWLRFSAAASPGNSGGPLLDKKGRVIGVVLRKSGSENLNYALPISEVLNAERVMVVHRRMKYQLDNMRFTKMRTMKKRIPLPRSYQPLHRQIIKHLDAFTAKLIADLLSENAANIFPNGKGSMRLLHNSYSAVFLNLISQKQDGTWAPFHPTKTTRAELGEGGFIRHGKMGNSTIMYIRKPDHISLTRFYRDSKLFLDLILKGYPFTRTVAGERIKITSFGKAKEKYTHTDKYGRKWLVRIWAIPFANSKVVFLYLPVPGGCVAIMRTGGTWNFNSHVLDLKTLADFSYLSYYGTFEQWEEFLKMKSVLPPVFSGIRFSYRKGAEFSYRSKRIAFSYDAKVMNISKQSDLKLEFSYFKDGGKIVWDVAEVVAGEDKNNKTAISITRNIRPDESMSDEDKAGWGKITRQRWPYNQDVYLSKGKTIIGGVYTGRNALKGLESQPLLYDIFYVREGKIDDKAMKSTLHRLMEQFKTYEY